MPNRFVQLCYRPADKSIYIVLSLFRLKYYFNHYLNLECNRQKALFQTIM